MGFLPRNRIWGVPRFEATYERFQEEGYLVRLENWRGTFPVGETPLEGPEFNEARRAAIWMLKNWVAR
jgi:hypothetical protein